MVAFQNGIGMAATRSGPVDPSHGEISWLIFFSFADDKSANVVPKVGVPNKQLSERVSNLINSDFKYFILYCSILYMNRLDIE